MEGEVITPNRKSHIFICGSYLPYLGIYVIVRQADEA